MFQLKRGFDTLSYEECNSLATSFINKVAVGLEIEAQVEDANWGDDEDDDGNEMLGEIADAFRCAVGKNRTRGTPYLSHKEVANVYEDGSVNLEVVTTPQKLCDIAKVHRYVCGVIKKYDAEIRPNVGNGAGGHQTVMFDHRNGYFTDTVARNVIQLSRFFAPALLWISCVQGTSARGNYRNLNRSAVRVPEHFPNDKYMFVHAKCLDSRGVYAFEFRYPDSHELSNIVQVTAVINTAIVLKAIRLSRFGVLECTQSYWDEVRWMVDEFYGGGAFEDEDKASSMIDRLMKYIGQEIEDLGHPYVFKAVKTLQKYPRWEGILGGTRKDVKLGLAEEVVRPRSKKRKEIAEEFFVCGGHLDVPDDTVAKVLAWRMGVKERTAKKYMKTVDKGMV